MGEGWVNSRGACSNTALLSSNRSNLQIAIHSNAEMLKSKHLKNCSGLSVRLHFWSQKVLPLNGEGDDEEIMWTKATEFLVCSSNSTFQKKKYQFYSWKHSTGYKVSLWVLLGVLLQISLFAQRLTVLFTFLRHILLILIITQKNCDLKTKQTYKFYKLFNFSWNLNIAFDWYNLSANFGMKKTKQINLTS